MSLRSASTIALLVAGLIAPQVAVAQVATVRGKVFDIDGVPLSGVHVKLEFHGETRRNVDKEVESDKNGGYIQTGLMAGPWTLTFTKDGYRPYAFETYISLGGLSEIPDLQLAPAPVATPTPEPVAAVEIDQAAEAEEALREDYTAAIAALTAGRNDEAQALFEKVLEAAPDAAPAHFNIGVIHLRTGRSAEAEASFRKAMELNPERSNSFLALAAVLDGAGRSAEGLEVLLSGVETFAEEPIYQLATAIAAINAGRESEARPALERVIALDPASADAHYHLATLEIAAGEVESSVAHLERYLELDPEGANAEVAKGLLAALKK
jgi:tetratricopeptide (TPR) repeat protein